MYKNNVTKGNALLRPLWVLVLSMVLLLSGAVLPDREVKAASVTPTREVDLAVGDVTVKKDEVVHVFQTGSATTGTSNKIEVPAGVNATIILENLNFRWDAWNDPAAQFKAFLRINDNARVRVLLKGKTTATAWRGLGMIVCQTPGSNVTIEDYGNGDGELHLTQGSGRDPFRYVYPALGAIDNGASSLTINSGKVVATSTNLGAAIGTYALDDYGAATLNLTINNPAVVEARTCGQGAAIGTSAGGTRNQTVNATINGGTVTAYNETYTTSGNGALRNGPAIGVAIKQGGEGRVNLNIPQSSTAKLNLTANGGSAAIGTNGDARYDGYNLVGSGFDAKHSVTANINGGTINITTAGQGPGIGVGAGNGGSAGNIHSVEANIGGGNITIRNDLNTTDTRSGDATGPSIGIGLLTQNQTMTCNVTGGNLTMLSQDKGNNLATSPAVGIGAMNKKNATTSKWTQSKGNTVNFNVTGGNVKAETRSADKDIMDVGTIANNNLNVKVDGGSFNVVNGRMNVTAKNSSKANVYPATVSIGSRTDSPAITSATIDGKSYGSGLKPEAGKLYLWTTSGTSKNISVAVSGDSRAYTNSSARLAYTNGFTFTEPNVPVKKTAAANDLGRLSVKSVGDNSITVGVSGVASGVPVAIQAFDHDKGEPVGNAQSYTTNKDYTFTGLSKEKTYDIKTFVSDEANFWPAEGAAIMVKPFAFAPKLKDAVLNEVYDGSVALDSKNYTYALAGGSVMPKGLQLSSDGRITGTPVEVKSYKFDVIATPTDDGIAAGNTRQATVTLNVASITTEALVVDSWGDTLTDCGCHIEGTSRDALIGVNSIIVYTVTPCAQHGFVKFNLNGADITGGVTTQNGIAQYSYTVKAGDTKLDMKAFMNDLEITNLEIPGGSKNIDIYANDENNASADALKSYVDNNVTLKATYNNNSTRTGKASDLGLEWKTDVAYDPKGVQYTYTAGNETVYTNKSLTVMRVGGQLNTLSPVARRVNENGYANIEALDLPQTADIIYDLPGGTISDADRKAPITWTTEVPENFGKEVTSQAYTFNGTAAVPEWVTLTAAPTTPDQPAVFDNSAVPVSIDVNISDKQFIAPVINIKDKVYDGNNNAEIIGDVELDSDSLIMGTEVELTGTPIAKFKSVNVGNDIPVDIYDLKLEGNNANNYILDLSQVTGNITPVTITIDGITMENKTVIADGNTQTIDIKGDLPEGVSVSYTYQQGEDEPTTVQPSLPGTYTVTAVFETDGNHVANPESVEATLTIKEQIKLPVKGITIKDKTYDGKTDAVIEGTPALDESKLEEGDEVWLEGQATAVFNKPDAGKNVAVTVSGLNLSGKDAGKYMLDLGQISGNINPVVIRVADIAMEDKTVTEDGNPQTIEIKGDLPKGVSVSYTYQKDGEEEAGDQAPSAAGTYTVTAVFKADDPNYVAKPETMTAILVIEEKSADVAVGEITTDLTEEQKAGMKVTVLKNGEPMEAEAIVTVGDKLTYQFTPEAVREAYVPYEFTMNGEPVAVTKLEEGKGYSAEYTVNENDTALKAEAKCVLLGNFSGDAVINIIDAQQIAQAAAASGSIEDMKKVAGDVNFDGKINVIDAQKVAQYAADTNVIF